VVVEHLNKSMKSVTTLR